MEVSSDQASHWMNMDSQSMKDLFCEHLAQFLQRCEKKCDVFPSQRTFQKGQMVIHSSHIKDVDFETEMQPLIFVVDLAHSNNFTFSEELLDFIISNFSSYLLSPLKNTPYNIQTKKIVYSSSIIVADMLDLFFDQVFFKLLSKEPSPTVTHHLKTSINMLLQIISHPDSSGVLMGSAVRILGMSLGLRYSDRHWEALGTDTRTSVVTTCLKTFATISFHPESDKLDASRKLIHLVGRLQQITGEQSIVAVESLTQCLQRMIEHVHFSTESDTKLFASISEFIQEWSCLPSLAASVCVEYVIKFYEAADSKNLIVPMVLWHKLHPTEDNFAVLLENGRKKIDLQVGVALQVMKLYTELTHHTLDELPYVDVLLGILHSEENSQRKFYLKSLALRCLLQLRISSIRPNQTLLETIGHYLTLPTFLIQVRAHPPEPLRLPDELLQLWVHNALIGLEKIIHGGTSYELPHRLAYWCLFRDLIRTIKDENYRRKTTCKCTEKVLELIQQLNAPVVPVTTAVLSLQEYTARQVQPQTAAVFPQLQVYVEQQQKKIHKHKVQLNVLLFSLLPLCVKEPGNPTDFSKWLAAFRSVPHSTKSSKVIHGVCEAVAEYLNANTKPEESIQILNHTFPFFEKLLSTNLQAYKPIERLSWAWKPAFYEFPLVDCIFQSLTRGLTHKLDLFTSLKTLRSESLTLVIQRRWLETLPVVLQMKMDSAQDEEGLRAYLDFFTSFSQRESYLEVAKEMLPDKPEPQLGMLWLVLNIPEPDVTIRVQNITKVLESFGSNVLKRKREE